MWVRSGYGSLLAPQEIVTISPVTRTLLIAPLVLLALAAVSLVPQPPRPEALEPATPALAAPAAQPTGPFGAAERAQRDGETEAALADYRALLQHPDVAVADEARVRITGLLLAQRKWAEAAEVIQPHATATAPELRHRAAFVLAEVARATKRCADATPRYQALVDGKALLTPYAHFGLIACAEESGNDALAMRHAQAILDADPQRRLRIEALEKLAAAELRRGNPARYLQIYDELLTLGATRLYRGTVLFSSAEVARDAGNQELATRKLIALVREYPEHPRAVAALDLLNATQASEGITWTQAALVRQAARQMQAAQEGFETALREAPDAPDAAMARYNLAAIALREGRETEAAREMRLAAERHPDASIAPTALLRAGRIIESNDGFDEAREIYTRLAMIYPSVNQGRQGRFRLGLVHFIRGDTRGALAAWEPLAQDGAERDLQALALLWQGKAYRQLGSAAEGDARLLRAMEVGPDTFGGIRARSIQSGDPRAAHAFQPFVLPPSLATTDEPRLAEWLASVGSSEAELAELRTTEPMYRRAIELTRLGMHEHAAWEFDGLAQQALQSSSPAARRYLLAETQMSLGYVSPALRTAEIAAKELGVPRTALPLSYVRLMMPLAFDEHLVGSANRHGADALLFASLVRQESRFEPAARSSAGALGLSQVMPATGRVLAGALGQAELTDDELIKPPVNLNLGAYYLSRQLKHYDGLILPALAAYNAGGGAVDRWLRDYGRTDMDLFAARIPYSETAYYLQVVFENYSLYKRAYGGT